MTQVSFEPLEAGSVSFTGPAADTLMGFVNERSLPLGFDVGLVPGVFAGAALMAFVTREIRLQGFEGGPSMLQVLRGCRADGLRRYAGGGLRGGRGRHGRCDFRADGMACTCFDVGRRDDRAPPRLGMGTAVARIGSRLRGGGQGDAAMHPGPPLP
jgi:hypothetical protein